MQNGEGDDPTAPQDFGFAQVTNLLGKVADAGGVIPARYALGMEDGAKSSPEEWKCCREARLELGSSLSIAFTFEEILPDLTRDARAKARQKQLVSLRVQLGRTLSLLKPISEDPILESYLSNKTAADIDFGLTLGQLNEALQLLDAAAREVLAQLSTSAPLPDMTWTPQGLAVATSGRCISTAHRCRSHRGSDRGSDANMEPARRTIRSLRQSGIRDGRSANTGGCGLGASLEPRWFDALEYEEGFIRAGPDGSC